eukprot:5034221-Ditylum_brightwellii.AAC.1
MDAEETFRSEIESTSFADVEYFLFSPSMRTILTTSSSGFMASPLMMREERTYDDDDDDYDLERNILSRANVDTSYDLWNENDICEDDDDEDEI